MMRVRGLEWTRAFSLTPRPLGRATKRGRETAARGGSRTAEGRRTAGGALRPPRARGRGAEVARRGVGGGRRLLHQRRAHVGVIEARAAEPVPVLAPLHH